MTEALKMYPSGFLGSALVAQTEPVAVITTAKQLFNKGLNPKVSRYVANEEVVSLWDATTAGTPEYKHFAFKERILRCALQAFGTQRVADWIGTQNDSPYFSDYHRRWIDETLHYVYGGKTRLMSENNWFSLLNTNNDTPRGERYSRVVKHYLLGEKLRSADDMHPYRGQITFVDFLSDWCAKEDGIKDLLGSLNNLFGKR